MVLLFDSDNLRIPNNKGNYAAKLINSATIN